MEVKEQIKQYISYNEQESKDKEMILKYIDLFDDVLTRNNDIVHFTSSGFVLNEKRDKVLTIYHNIYNSWSWTGGHADGDSNFLNVAITEVQEETGVKNVKPIVEEIFTIDVLTCIGHIKKGKYISPHIHVSVAYLLEANENELIRVKEDENSNVAWLSLDTFLEYVTEEQMKPIYTKIIEKAKKRQLIK
jgi:ADP-ribose pyrophosphatase